MNKRMDYKEIKEFLDGMTKEEFEALIEENRADKICDIMYDNLCNSYDSLPSVTTCKQPTIEEFLESIRNLTR